MRKFYLGLVGLTTFGSICDVLIIGVAIAVATLQPDIAWSISVDTLFQQFLSFIYWIKQLAYWVLPDSFVQWVFALPAIPYFAVRLVISVGIGWWAWRKAKALATASTLSNATASP
ncbi:MAG: hypothetical protein AAGA84_12070 [Pseudomonadota bacterium]